MSSVLQYSEDNAQLFEWYEGIAIIRFYADWCAPCVQSFPVFEQLANQFSKTHPDIKFGKINIDQSPVLTMRYQVFGLPSTLIFKNGAIIKRIAGVKTLQEYHHILSLYLPE